MYLLYWITWGHILLAIDSEREALPKLRVGDDRGEAVFDRLSALSNPSRSLSCSLIRNKCILNIFFWFKIKINTTNALFLPVIMQICVFQHQLLIFLQLIVVLKWQFLFSSVVYFLRNDSSLFLYPLIIYNINFKIKHFSFHYNIFTPIV